MSTDVFEPLAGLEGVGSAAGAARDAVDVLLRDRGCAGSGPDMTAEALLRGAHASAALAGSTSTPDEVRRGAADGLGLRRGPADRRADGLAPQLDKAPVQVWTRLHQLAAADLSDEDQLGHLRPVREPVPDDIPGLPPAPGARRDVGAVERSRAEPDPPDEGARPGRWPRSCTPRSPSCARSRARTGPVARWGPPNTANWLPEASNPGRGHGARRRSRCVGRFLL